MMGQSLIGVQMSGHQGEPVSFVILTAVFRVAKYWSWGCLWLMHSEWKQAEKSGRKAGSLTIRILRLVSNLKTCGEGLAGAKQAPVIGYLSTTQKGGKREKNYWRAREKNSPQDWHSGHRTSWKDSNRSPNHTNPDTCIQIMLELLPVNNYFAW